MKPASLNDWLALGCGVGFGALALAVVARRTKQLDDLGEAAVGRGGPGAERLCRVAAPKAIALEALAFAMLPRLLTRDRVLVIGAPLLAGSLGHAMKRAFPRLRPFPRCLTPTGNESFPSTHSAHAAALSFALAAVGRSPALYCLALVFPAAVGVERIRASAHWPSDVVAGLLLGGASAFALRALLDRR